MTATKNANDTKSKPLLEIPNYHGADAPALEFRSEDYVSYFENEHGEQWIFIRRSGADHATVTGGDIDWETHEVLPRDRAAVRDAMLEGGVSPERADKMLAMIQPDPLVPDLVLNEPEKTWLNLAWHLSCSREEQEAALVALAEDLATQVPQKMLSADPLSTEYRTAHLTLALLIGKAAGMRGFGEDATLRLYGQVQSVLSRS